MSQTVVMSSVVFMSVAGKCFTSIFPTITSGAYSTLVIAPSGPLPIQDNLF